MIEYEELRNDIDRYLMERFKYRKSLVCLTVDNIIATRRNSRIDLYLRIRKVESRFPPDCLIIARLGFSKERIGRGTHFLRFLTGIALKYGFRHIGIECANEKSSSFAKKLGFSPIDGENYAITVNSIMSYFSMN
ncbi:GNAT family N-acetyltransferase [Parabacteroides distasonis]|uniref:GNAT family N-acetyltransferase n=1 Tax=Parabacteroides distasonis TaxID=823 RepID=A0A5C6K1P2_PARDI|nr:GNAT family N-acetyltransferase [Parabacteroides distasonis]TWV56975.1 GNAT family N-acetyltransferase [Parabacteroides distasonis]